MRQLLAVVLLLSACSEEPATFVTNAPNGAGGDGGEAAAEPSAGGSMALSPLGAGGAAQTGGSSTAVSRGGTAAASTGGSSFARGGTSSASGGTSTTGGASLGGSAGASATTATGGAATTVTSPFGETYACSQLLALEQAVYWSVTCKYDGGPTECAASPCGAWPTCLIRGSERFGVCIATRSCAILGGTLNTVTGVCSLK